LSLMPTSEGLFDRRSTLRKCGILTLKFSHHLKVISAALRQMRRNCDAAEIPTASVHWPFMFVKKHKERPPRLP
jgi:hypothetical protein